MKSGVLRRVDAQQTTLIHWDQVGGLTEPSGFPHEADVHTGCRFAVPGSSKGQGNM